MILPMKKVMLLAISGERENALRALRDVGVMQIDVQNAKPTPRSLEAAEAFRAACRVESELARFAEERKITPSDDFTPDRSDAEYLAGCRALLERRATLQEEKEKIHLRLRQLAPWGNFRLASLNELAAHGIVVKLCRGTRKDLEKLAHRDDCAVAVLFQDRRNADFIIVADHEIDVSEFPVVKLTESDDPVLLQIRRDAIDKEILAVEEKLTNYVSAQKEIAEARDALLADAEFSAAYDAAEDHDAVIALSGYVPAESLDALRDAAKTNGWGLVFNDPAPGDNVPVLLRESKWSKTIKPLFDFLGIMPGYHEMDISGGVLIFFTIFYAMIIGDAGYGALFAVACAFATWKFRKKKAAKTALKLGWILSCATILWGALSGNWFGTGFGGLKCLTDPAVKDASIQCFCFALAVIQLSLGHIWKAIHDANWKSVGANCGWMLIIWGNFFLAIRIIVWPGDYPAIMNYCYIAGLVLVLLCGLDWKNPADVFQFPFSMIGSFSDLLSYIRLFAVGMAGTYIAGNFNGMGLDVMRASAWFIPGGLLVILFGHALNLSLGLMSVLVHAVRLNTLEFSNHTGLTWSGNAFHPFANHKTSKNKGVEK